MLGTRVAVRSASECSAHASCVPSTRVPSTRDTGCVLRICALTARREDSQAPPCVSVACQPLRAARTRALKHACSARGCGR
eukprot:9096676-Alexandrium_andersonii.AAC.1